MGGKSKLVVAMLIYGSIGVFVRNIELSAIEIAFLRAVIGSLFLIGAGFVLKKGNPLDAIRGGGKIFLLSGAALGINWFLLFKAFEHTSVSNAILAYYLAPVIVILASPFVLGERLTLHKVICSFAALAGLFMIVMNTKTSGGMGSENLTGIFFALLAAVFYAGVILINKKASPEDGFQTTLIQLISSALVLMPVLMTSGDVAYASMDGLSIVMVVLLGVVHTGVAYLLYFSSMKDLEAHTVAVYCYIDPISAVMFAAIFLGEKMTIVELAGGAMILGAAYFIDYKPKRRVDWARVEGGRGKLNRLDIYGIWNAFCMERRER